MFATRGRNTYEARRRKFFANVVSQKDKIMRLLTQSVGVDIAKDNFVVCFECSYDNFSTKIKGTRKFNNNPSGFKSFVTWITKKADSAVFLQVIMEATGRYHENLAYHLFEHHIRVSIVLPNKIIKFAQSLNIYSKTDPIDAAVIARYGSTQRPMAWQPASKYIRVLRELSRERQDVIKIRTQVSNRIAAIKSGKDPLKSTLRRLERQIKLFKTQLEQIEAQIQELCEEDEVLGHSVKLLSSIPYIGKITACSIIAETGNFVLFENRNQLIKYAGMDIVEKRSGSSVRGHGRISKRGNSHLRSSVYMSAVGLIGYPGVFQDTYERLLARHNCKRKALMGVQRQLLLVAFGVHQSQVQYNEEKHRNRVKTEVGEHQGSPTVAHLA